MSRFRTIHIAFAAACLCFTVFTIFERPGMGSAATYAAEAAALADLKVTLSAAQTAALSTASPKTMFAALPARRLGAWQSDAAQFAARRASGISLAETA